MAQVLVVTSKVKNLVKIAGLRTSAEFIETLSAAVGEIVIASAKKTKADNRGTIKARDLPNISFAEETEEE